MQSKKIQWIFLYLKNGSLITQTPSITVCFGSSDADLPRVFFVLSDGFFDSAIGRFILSVFATLHLFTHY